MSEKTKVQRTLEELLEEALVPMEEQPYEVPENWVWVKFGSVARLINGYAFKSIDYTDKGIPVIRISDLNGEIKGLSNAIKVSEQLYNEKFVVNNGDLLIAMSGATTGKTGVFKSDEIALQNQRVGNIKEVDQRLLIKEYKNFFIKKSKEDILNLAYGGAQPNISGKLIEDIKSPLPPVKEQKRIADKVERLLNKIDEAKQLIDEAKETFELRRAAILDKAFRGELTAKWREENSNVEAEEKFTNTNKDNKMSKKNKNDTSISVPFEIPKSWKWVRLRDVASFKAGYAFKSQDFVTSGHQLIRMGNLYKNELNLERSPVFLPDIYDEKIIEKYKVNNGDILLSLTGTKYKRDYGYAIRVNNQSKTLLLNQRILSLSPNDLSDYFFYYLQSNAFRHMFFSFETGGVNQGNVGSTAVEAIYFPFPPQEEGLEIEVKIEELLDAEKSASKLLNLENQVEAIKHSILSKAFRGELGTNDPTEESSIELLKEVLQDKLN